MNKKDKERLKDSLVAKGTHIFLPMNMGKVEVFYSDRIEGDTILLMHKDKPYIIKLDSHEGKNAIKERKVKESSL